MIQHLEDFRLYFPPPVLDWQLSAGDELQSLYSDPRDVLRVILTLGSDRDWHVGLGIGTVEYPLPATVHEATGAAFIAARKAVTEAKESSSPAVEGSVWAPHVESVLGLVCSVRRRRTANGAAATVLADAGLTQCQIATELDITQSSVSRRLSAAQWHEEHATHATLLSLLALADGADPTVAATLSSQP